MSTTYTIGQVSTALNIPSSTLRYYDKLHFLPHLKKSASGIRQFDQADIDIIRIIECLKLAGLSIKEIQQFTQMLAEGDASLAKRQQFFHQIRQNFIQKLTQMQQTLAVLDFKCAYYDQATADGTEALVQKNMSLSSVIPDQPALPTNSPA
ncbi:MerR family transcriptional regulator [Levilactobacillus namurensis]|uniref:MerR family transcriptional regulator n=1 Tax=Levilactobacillus namurensis TaxID=380393 RepID=UPI002232C47A|nr:MerR family transcriptional regulator [Levilactobacillus namurensis]MCW3778811.1 MerR family transcriptional regulator [Levilactobacillus namurensis]MDT7019385.1 MerR family transcriptional regulator [Levilactobacillus namurensis]WNN66018.1 MerR family transcriptional regulator [Levilactobacillus namurensis]